MVLILIFHGYNQSIFVVVVDSVFACWHCVEVGCIVNISDNHAASRAAFSPNS
jgi:hypothetical protein